MEYRNEQYLKEVWEKLLQYLSDNQLVDIVIINNFFKPCFLYAITDEKVIIVAPSIINKQILQSQNKEIEASFIDILNVDHNFIVEVLLKTELTINKVVTTPISKIDTSDFVSLPIQKIVILINFVVGDCN